MSQEKPQEKPKEVKKTPPLDAEVYIKMAKDKASPSGKLMQQLNQNKELEFERTVQSINLETAMGELEELRRRRRSFSPQETENVAVQLFKGKSPEQIQEILKNLTPEMIANLQALAQAVDTNPTTLLLRQPQPAQQQPKQDMTIELLKMIIEQNAKKTDDLIAVVRLVKELQPAQPAQVIPPKDAMQQTMDTIKIVTEMQKPFYEGLSKKDKELSDARLRELEAKMPGDLSEQIKYIKEMAPVLGLTGGQTNELDLRLEEMRENREIDLKRLDWEQKKYEMEAEADMTKWEQIGKILQGPLGNVVRDIGSAGADRVRGQPQVRVQTGSRQPKPVQTQCPNCNKPIFVDAEAETAVCGSCGAILQRQGNPEPAPTPVTAQPTQQPAQAVEQANEEEEEEEEEEPENGHNATEGKQ